MCSSAFFLCNSCSVRALSKLLMFSICWMWRELFMCFSNVYNNIGRICNFLCFGTQQHSHVHYYCGFTRPLSCVSCKKGCPFKRTSFIQRFNLRLFLSKTNMNLWKINFPWKNTHFAEKYLRSAKNIIQGCPPKKNIGEGGGVENLAGESYFGFPFCPLRILNGTAPSKNGMTQIKRVIQKCFYFHSAKLTDKQTAVRLIERTIK